MQLSEGSLRWFGLVWGSFSYATAGSNTQFWRRNSEESQVAAAAIISDFF